MRKRKSKFQQRLEEIVKKLKEEEIHSGDDPDGKVKLHEMDYKRPPTNRKWISTEIDKPPYYTPIDIWDGMEVLEHWARVSNGEQDFYVNNQDDRVKYHVTHWAKREGQVYPKYEPMTKTDHIISLLQKEVIQEGIRPLNDQELAYNHGINTAIKIITKGS
jgi:hypothetical protein